MTDTNNLPPEWAIQRALEILYADYQASALPTVDNVATYPSMYAAPIKVARYIAEHEEEPVDPLLLKAREIVVEFYSTNHPNSRLADVREGTRDDCKAVQLALHTLRAAAEEK